MKRIVSDKAPGRSRPLCAGRRHWQHRLLQRPAGPGSRHRVLPEGVVAQTHQSLKNLQAVLAEAGHDCIDNVVKTTVFVQDLGDFGTVNEIYAQYFHEYPARSCVQIAALPKNALVEIECIAARG